MRRLARVTPVLLVLILALGAAGFAASASGDDPAPPDQAQPAPTVEEAPIVGVIEALGVIDAAERYATAYWAQVGEYANAVNLAAWVAAHTPPVVHHASSGRIVTSAPSFSGPCGGATNGADRFIGRESGGDPSILNGGAHASSPFNGSGRAFGCYQIMPSTWSSSCGDIGTYDPASQARCASRLGMSAWGG